MLVKTIMHRTPAVCVPFDNANAIATLMRRDGLDFVPVVENEPTHMFAGVVTDRDLCTRVLAEGKDPTHTRIADVMTSPGFSCKPRDTIQTATRLMRTHGVHHLAVVDGNGCVVGVVSMDELTRGQESALSRKTASSNRTIHSQAARRAAVNQASCPLAFSNAATTPME